VAERILLAAVMRIARRALPDLQPEMLRREAEFLHAPDLRTNLVDCFVDLLIWPREACGRYTRQTSS